MYIIERTAWCFIIRHTFAMDVCTAVVGFFVAYTLLRVLVDMHHTAHLPIDEEWALKHVANGAAARRRAWILSLLVSAVLSYEGALRALPAALTEPNFAALALGDLPAARATCDIFIGFCALELVLAQWEYPTELRVLEGWSHHVFYIALLVALRVTGHANGFWVWVWCELPTLVLSVGHVMPAYKRPRLFRALFWVLRVCLFDALLLRFYLGCDRGDLWWTLPPGVLIAGVHAWWGWKQLLPPPRPQRLD